MLSVIVTGAVAGATGFVLGVVFGKQVISEEHALAEALKSHVAAESEFVRKHLSTELQKLPDELAAAIKKL